MPLQTNNPSRKLRRYDVKKLVQLGIVISIALVLSYFERFIPLNFIFPGLKLGLANVITLLVLVYFTTVDAFIVVLLRIIMSALFSVSVTSFFFSLAGGLLSLMVMTICLRLFSALFSVIGISIIGAVFHNVGQVIVLGIIVDSTMIAIRWLPYLMINGVVMGGITGLIVYFLKQHIDKLRQRIGSY